MPRQSVEEFPVLREIVAAMKKQQRRAVSGRQQLERNFTDLEALHVVPLRGPSRMIVIPVPHARRELFPDAAFCPKLDRFGGRSVRPRP
jgi:hypothetical protein